MQFAMTDALKRGRAPASAHLTEARLAAYLDGRLTRDQCDEAMAHFAGCSACRREMAAMQAVLARAPSNRWRMLAPLATVAAVLVLALVPVVTRRAPAAGDQSQSPDRIVRSETVSAFAITSPAEGGMVADSGVTFTWHSAGPDVSYRITLQDAAGAVVWTASTSGTSLSVPPSVRLTKGAGYYWSVDAIEEHGRSARAGVHRFTVR
jgi:Putative zinc-finger